MTDSVVNSADTDSGKVSAVSKKQLRRWRKYLAEERLEADTYRYLARRRSGDEREVLQELSIAEERHEQYWVNLLGEDALPTPRASMRSRLLNFFTRIFGTIFMLAMMQRAEQRHDYEADLDVP
ncbi:MAG: rubrerythrin family protein, partial [Varibaculum cambriense]|nr:rubrerythrin family protein [Varibaculum cambriense]